MAGARQVAGLDFGIDRHMNRRGPVRRRDSRRNVFPGVDGDREGRAEDGGVFDCLLRAEWSSSTRSGVRARQINPRACLAMKLMACGRNDFGGNDEIAFVFPIFVIDQDDEFPLLDVPDRVFDAVERSWP